jgi:hypothetical protein
MGDTGRILPPSRLDTVLADLAEQQAETLTIINGLWNLPCERIRATVALPQC